MIQTYWDEKYYSKGKLVWEKLHQKNSLANQGALAILQAYYQGVAASLPTIFYVRLCNYSPLVTDTLATVQNEPSGSGYTPQPVPASTVGFPINDVAPDGNARITSSIVTFTATTGNIGPVVTAYLATTSNNTGILQGFLPLSMQRTILAGDSMTYQFYVEEGNS
jgi:hypothetical protein